MTDKKCDFEELLHNGLVNVPKDFHAEVMQQVTAFEQARQQPYAPKPPQSNPVGLGWWQWSALICGGVLGAGQVLRLIFAVWLVSAAG